MNPNPDADTLRAPSVALHPLPFTLRQLQYVLAVADLGSFRRAAEACHVAQPSLSAQVAEVESALGVTLFERDRRSVHLTPAGQALVARARRLLVDAADLQTEATRHVDPRTGVLRLGILPTLAPYLLPDLAPALRKALPRLEILWREDKTPVLSAALQAGEIDAMLVAAEAELGGPLQLAPLGRDPFVLAMPPDHRLAQAGTPLPVADLAGERVLLLDDGHCLRDQALAVCNAAGAAELGFRATSLPTLVQMVAGGAGVTLLPTVALPVEARRGEVAVRPLASPAPYRSLVLAWRPSTPRAQVLAEVAGIWREALPPQVEKDGVAS